MRDEKENCLYTPTSEAEALEIYRKLSLIRQCQETIIREYPKDEIKTPVHLGIGLEGISVGVTHCLPPDTRSFGQLRNHGEYLSITGETDKFFGELYGKVTGTGGGKAGSMHLSSIEHGLMSTSGIVASTIPLAVGGAFAAKYRGTDQIALAMFGDAAVEEGEFWESLNFACLHQLRVLFVCEDNDLSIHTFGKDRRGFRDKSIAAAVGGFDCHVFEADGTDVLVVIDTVKKALDVMNSDPKPAFLHLKWFRFLEHVGPNTDFHVGYRPKPLDEEFTATDPVYKYTQFLLSRGFDASQLRKIREELALQVEGSVSRAKAAPYPTEEDLYKGIFT
jgi:pyruvate dehydrogenase E1 component alpha subunit